ncbi:hypothetical protein [Vulcaniibacterium tengchongense]|uniref:Uncharacterized protein n=1 Tax=Vulcaniibacterium tengchongense TaxID=1273429 RepID=A0A3N4VPX4_9GAMM|nr:hypothetical protein [Vulcaniibacterium tengchongense]RPE81939.1 hypothetical protein EDC50_1142 [Vulcaniibacterium tengchongense]
MADRKHERPGAPSGAGERPDRAADRRPQSDRAEDLRQTAPVPQGGVNPEMGDMDAAADPDRDPDDGDGGLPGKAGGGLMGA